MKSAEEWQRQGTLFQSLPICQTGLAIETITAIQQDAIESQPIPDDELAKVHQTLNFFRSVILSGEHWSDTCQNSYEESHQTLLRAARQLASITKGRKE